MVSTCGDPCLSAQGSLFCVCGRHYILRGPPDTPYAGGEYYGQLIFPPEFPFKPPAIKMQTPSGRFAPDTKICTSMSDYHPHTWQPGWNTSTILIGLLSFMCSDEMTTGSVSASAADRKKLATQSHAFNRAQKRFCQLFPEYAGPQTTDLPNMGAPAKVEAQAKVGPFPTATNGGFLASPLSNTVLTFSPTTAIASTATALIPPNQPAQRPRRDLFGLRSSVVVLAVVAYLFISRAMEKGGVI